jgi:hypothetical protein
LENNSSNKATALFLLMKLFLNGSVFLEVIKLSTKP